MRVAVLNGVNLDALDKRDPEIYGGIGLAELESQIYAWSKVLECTTRCRQTNHEGQFVDWCHDALDWAGGVILNPGAWSHYSYAIRDAVELFKVPVVEVHLSNIEKREEWRRHSVIAELAAKRILGKGPEGYKEALEWLAGSEQGRAPRGAPRRAAARHERRQRALPDRPPELERGRARRAGRRGDALHRLPLRAEGPGARGRPLRADRARGDRRSLDPAGRADDLDRGGRRHGRGERAAARGGVETGRPVRSRRAAARDQGARGDRSRCAKPRQSPTGSSTRSRRSSSPAAPSASWPGVSASSSTSTARRSSHSTRSSPRPRTAPARMRTSRDVEIPANTLVTIDAGCRVDGYASDCTRTFATGDLPDELARAYDGLPGGRARGPRAYGPGVSGGTPTPPRAT